MNASDNYEQRVKQVFEQNERCQRLAQIQGVGPLIATALVAAVGNAREFKSGRELSAWFGLVPRQQSSGGRDVLLGISKRGDRYLRMLLIHGARAAVRYAERRADPGGAWIKRLKARRGPNVTAVAVANKNARVAWKLLSSGEHYLPLPPRPRDKTGGARAPRAPLGQRTGRRGALRVVTDPKPAAFPPPSKSLRGRAANPL